ncbi:hypothetical protein RPD76_07675 [Methylomonas sp. MV1]|uniref:hypothetical protein n=1 Tax=Methylomonas sp. MV1 TaxID=3073620 RepID=UPI0028A543C2|nr:hypothetical protein [Methylomonas sp. MV1]MDT4329785.1 hypothetical protein [Methylomonas sp. MV1]
MTPNQVRAKLIERNSNMRRFAKANNYEARTVQQVVHRYAGTGRVPRGITTFNILRDLSKAIGAPVIDGLEELIKTDNEEKAA